MRGQFLAGPTKLLEWRKNEPAFHRSDAAKGFVDTIVKEVERPIARASIGAVREQAKSNEEFSRLRDQMQGARDKAGELPRVLRISVHKASRPFSGLVKPVFNCWVCPSLGTRALHTASRPRARAELRGLRSFSTAETELPTFLTAAFN